MQWNSYILSIPTLFKALTGTQSYIINESFLNSGLLWLVDKVKKIIIYIFFGNKDSTLSVMFYLFKWSSILSCCGRLWIKQLLRIQNSSLHYLWAETGSKNRLVIRQHAWAEIKWSWINKITNHCMESTNLHLNKQCWIHV